MSCVDDIERKRHLMVEQQLVGRGIKDERVLNAFRNVPRHRFIDTKHQHQAYEDHPLSIGLGQTISQPYMVAAMVELLVLKGNEKVLEIGTGSGYQTAILAELADFVYSIEYHAALVEEAKSCIDALGYKNIELKCGDGGYGWKENAPFDAIIISAATPALPDPLKEQAKDGGMIVCPRGSGYVQTLMRYYRRGGNWQEEDFFNCVFVPLVGKYGA